MPLFRKVATLGAALAAAKRYARQNPDKVNRYADQAAAFVDGKTQGKYRKQIDSAIGQVRRQTGHGGQGYGGSGYGGPGYGSSGHGGSGHGRSGHGGPGHGGPGQGSSGHGDGGHRSSSYPSWREDRPGH